MQSEDDYKILVMLLTLMLVLEFDSTAMPKTQVEHIERARNVLIAGQNLHISLSMGTLKMTSGVI